MKLKISNDLSLPVNAVTEALAFMGRRGAGKSYAATKLAELFYSVGAQFVALDPVGIWYGLRLAPDGKGKGIDIPIFGGLHGDIPLEATGGALIADLIVDRGISCVLDVSQFESDTDKARFAGDFAARFFFRKKASPSAVHVFAEEAQEFIPQNPQRGEEKMLHAWQRMVRLGRNFGIGISQISQRPQDVNKKSLNQTECLFCFQLTAKHERKAIEDWVAEKGLNDDLNKILPALNRGHAHVWSPVWLNINSEVAIAEKTTFAGGSTPKVGGGPISIKPLAPMEMDQISKDMAATVERAKANDPKLLRAELAKLRSELAKASDKPAIERQTIKEIQILNDGHVKRLEVIAEKLMGEGNKLMGEGNKLVETGEKMLSEAAAVRQTITSATARMAGQNAPVRPIQARQPVRVTIPRDSPSPNAGSNEVGKGGLRRILNALANRPGLTNRQIGVRAGLSSKSGSFGTYMSKARSCGWIRDEGERRFITDEGLAALGSFTELPSGRALLDYWLGELGNSGDARILRTLAESYPEPMTNEQIGEAAEISHQSGSFGTYMSKLRSLELVQGSRGQTKASDEFFEAHALHPRNLPLHLGHHGKDGRDRRVSSED